MRRAWRGRRQRRVAGQRWLVGDRETPGRILAPRVRALTVAAVLTANLVGTAVVVCFALWALPKPDGVFESNAILVNLVAGALYLLGAIAVGLVWGIRTVELGPNGTLYWLERDLTPTAKERRFALRAPLRIMLVQVALWAFATLIFTVLNFTYSPLLGLGVGMTVALGGITTSTAAYILAELAQRPVAARALAAGRVPRRLAPGVASRWLLAWALGTGAPIAGLIAIGIVGLTNVEIDEKSLAISIIALGAIALVFGALVTALAAYLTVHPIGAIRRGLERVRDGDLEVEVGVWDGSEIGLLQSGFNEMVAGLRERERIRDLFGRQVGEEAAQASLDAGQPEFDGQVSEVAVLFVDVIGSTALAAGHDPKTVVSLLNRFFTAVVAVVERNGGWVNKFQGDAALAIFGAPGHLPGFEAAALRAARELDRELDAHIDGLAAAIGVSAGRVVAGHIGTEQRFEYTVIGDPVNEAARLTELAKAHSPRVLASGTAVAAAGTDEAQHWRLGETVTLRGRSEETLLAAPLRSQSVRAN